MTAPDPGLTDLIAAHWTVHEIDDDGDWLTCDCGERFATPRGWAAHVALVVERHMRGRIAELEADIERRKVRNTLSRMGADDDPETIAAWREAVIGWKDRAEKAEASVVRAAALVQDEDGDWLPGASASELRAALEGEQR